MIIIDLPFSGKIISKLANYVPE